MEYGTISYVTENGQGYIRPDKPGGEVMFTRAVFQAHWYQAITDRRVEYSLRRYSEVAEWVKLLD
ncbi:hypothetical protein VC33_18340 [Pseudomonas fluorescens]|nr:hypothetical protein VC33_18340 [Pseudomonas fluorescens]OOG15065.1 hypothetical protein BMS17_24215 [Pseudomonas sp. C9]